MVPPRLLRYMCMFGILVHWVRQSAAILTQRSQDEKEEDWTRHAPTSS